MSEIVQHKRNNMNMQEYQVINVLKFICAIFVVGIHTNIMSNSSNAVQWYVLHVFFRIAVPFFFICSGFLFGKKIL